jgi:hypothetical protein
MEELTVESTAYGHSSVRCASVRREYSYASESPLRRLLRCPEVWPVLAHTRSLGLRLQALQITVVTERVFIKRASWRQCKATRAISF